MASDIYWTVVYTDTEELASHGFDGPLFFSSRELVEETMEADSWYFSRPISIVKVKVVRAD